MTKFEILKQKYNISTIDELTECQLTECIQSKEFVDVFSIELIREGFWGCYPEHNKVLKYLKKAIEKNLLLQVLFDDAEGVYNSSDKRPPSGFHYCGLNKDGIPEFDYM